jgi:hypothetical protein
MTNDEDQLLASVRDRSAAELAAPPEVFDPDALGIPGFKLQRIVLKGLSLVGSEPDPVTELPPPCDRADVAAVEAELGVTLPPLLVRLYTEVADGRFGPGDGFVPVSDLTDLWQSYAVDLIEAEDLTPWPDGLLPVCNLDQTLLACVDCTSESGPIVGFEFDDLDPDDPDGLEHALGPLSPSLEAWLRAWLSEPSAHNQ